VDLATATVPLFSENYKYLFFKICAVSLHPTRWGEVKQALIYSPMDFQIKSGSYYM